MRITLECEVLPVLTGGINEDHIGVQSVTCTNWGK